MSLADVVRLGSDHAVALTIALTVTIAVSSALSVLGTNYYNNKARPSKAREEERIASQTGLNEAKTAREQNQTAIDTVEMLKETLASVVVSLQETQRAAGQYAKEVGELRVEVVRLRIVTSRLVTFIKENGLVPPHDLHELENIEG